MPSPRIHWTAYLWPGLAHLWLRGSWAGLVVAVGFTAVANVLLLATLVYRNWISGDALAVGYAALAVVWLLAWWQGRWDRRAILADAAGEEIPVSPAVEKRRAGQDKLFREAQQRYLESDWVATERLLLKLLKQDARDVEGRLMLTTLWRHQGRCREALRQLERLERLESAALWQREIANERKHIEKALALSKPAITETIRTENETPQESPNRRLAA